MSISKDVIKQCLISKQRVIADYTPLVREAAKRPSAKVYDMQQQQFSMAAEPENNFNVQLKCNKHDTEC
jgi:hypothetical protein